MLKKSRNSTKRTLQIDDLQVVLQEKPRQKHLRLRVEPDGSVHVSAPKGVAQKHVEEFVRSKRQWIAAAQKRYEGSPAQLAATASPSEVRQWRQAVEAVVPGLVQHWEPILGVKAGALVYRKMKSRWGSCQPSTGRICINVALALYPPKCLEYVVVHELAHLKVPGHGADFHALMDAVLPDWRDRRAKLGSAGRRSK